MLLDKAGLLAEMQLLTTEVELPTGSVIVSEIGATEWDEIVNSDKYKTDGEYDDRKIQPLLVARAVLNANGSRMFTDEEALQLAQSAKAPFRKIVNAVMSLNGLGGDVVKNSLPSRTEN